MPAPAVQPRDPNATVVAADVRYAEVKDGGG